MSKILSCFTDRYLVLTKDGIPVPSSQRLVVLDASGNNPAAVKALQVYADELHKHGNWKLACDIDGYLADPKNAPPQHASAEGEGLALFVGTVIRKKGVFIYPDGHRDNLGIVAKILPRQTGRDTLRDYILDKMAADNPDVSLECFKNSLEIRITAIPVEKLFL